MNGLDYLLISFIVMVWAFVGYVKYVEYAEKRDQKTKG